MAEYIEREALLELYDMGKELEEYAEVLSVPITVIRQNINDMPAADAAPVRHGRWESVKNPQWPAYSHDKCSICGWWNTRNALCYDGHKKPGHSLNYCPNCGAKMDLEGGGGNG